MNQDMKTGITGPLGYYHVDEIEESLRQLLADGNVIGLVRSP